MARDGLDGPACPWLTVCAKLDPDPSRYVEGVVTRESGLRKEDTFDVFRV